MYKKALEYAENAREAVDLASRLPPGSERATLLKMTETWLVLAEAAVQHARFVARRDRSREDDASPSPN